MCGICGCGSTGTLIDGRPTSHPTSHPTGQSLQIQGQGELDLTDLRIIEVERNLLSKNDAIAEQNRSWFNRRGIFVLNLVSSPGSGKTTLLTTTLNTLKDELALTVIEGDQQTSNDAERIRQTGVKATQVNTGKGCHLDAEQVKEAIAVLKPENDSVLFIENVGNLVCPAGFDLGEAHKVAVLSVTEGEDKPLKYPDMFYAASMMLINKIDLLPYLDFDLEQCIGYAKRVNPDIKVFTVSATTGEGMGDWYDFLRKGTPANVRK